MPGSVQSSELRDFTFAIPELVLPNVGNTVTSACIWSVAVDELEVTILKSRERIISLSEHIIDDLDLSRDELVLSHFAASIGFFIGARCEQAIET